MDGVISADLVYEVPHPPENPNQLFFYCFLQDGIRFLA